MNYFTCVKDAKIKDFGNHYVYMLANEKNGCVNGCKMGMSIYTSSEYLPTAVHDDQEGFYVTEGTGFVKIGDKEFAIEEGTSFIVPAGVEHTIRKSNDSESVKLFWFHAAV